MSRPGALTRFGLCPDMGAAVRFATANAARILPGICTGAVLTSGSTPRRARQQVAPCPARRTAPARAMIRSHRPTHSRKIHSHEEPQP